MPQPNYIQDFLRRTGDLTYVPETDYESEKNKAAITKVETIAQKALALHTLVNDPSRRSRNEQTQSFPTIFSQDNLSVSVQNALQQTQVEWNSLDNKIAQAKDLPEIPPYGFPSPDRAEQEIYREASKDPELKALLQWEILHDINDANSDVFGKLQNFADFETENKRVDKAIKDSIIPATRMTGRFANPKLTDIPKAAYAMLSQDQQAGLESYWKTLPQGVQEFGEGAWKELRHGGADYGVGRAIGAPIISEQLQWDRPAGIAAGFLTGLGAAKMLGFTARGIQAAGSPVLKKAMGLLSSKYKQPIQVTANKLGDTPILGTTLKKGGGLGKSLWEGVKKGENFGGATFTDPFKGGGKSIALNTAEFPVGMALEMGLQEADVPVAARIPAQFLLPTTIVGAPFVTKLAATGTKKLGQQVKIGTMNVTKRLEPIDVYASEKPITPKPKEAGTDPMFPDDPTKPKEPTVEYYNQSNPVDVDPPAGTLEQSEAFDTATKLAKENKRRAKSGLEPLKEGQFNTGQNKPTKTSIFMSELHDEEFTSRQVDNIIRTNIKNETGSLPTPDELPTLASRIAHLKGVDSRVKRRVTEVFDSIMDKLPELTKNGQMALLDEYSKVLKAISVLNSVPKPRATAAKDVIEKYLGVTEETLITISNTTDANAQKKALQAVLLKMKNGLGEENFTKLQDAFATVKNVLQEERDRLYNSGLISKETRDKFTNDFPDYTPTYWVKDTVDEFGTGAQTLNDLNSRVGDPDYAKLLADGIETDNINGSLDLNSTLIATLAQNDKAILQNEMKKTFIYEVLDDSVMETVSKAEGRTTLDKAKKTFTLGIAKEGAFTKEYDTLAAMRADENSLFYAARVITDEEEALLKLREKEIKRYPDRDGSPAPERMLAADVAKEMGEDLTSPKVTAYLAKLKKAEKLAKEVLDLQERNVPIKFQSRQMKNVVNIFEDGERKLFQVNPNVARTINQTGLPLWNLNKNWFGALFHNALVISRNMLSYGVTQNPIFPLVMAPIDILTGILKSSDADILLPLRLIPVIARTITKELTRTPLGKLPLIGTKMKTIADADEAITKAYEISGADQVRYGDIGKVMNQIKNNKPVQGLDTVVIKPTKEFIAKVKNSGGHIIDGTSRSIENIVDEAEDDVIRSTALKLGLSAKDTKEWNEFAKKILKAPFQAVGGAIKFGFKELPQYQEKLVRKWVFEKTMKKNAPKLWDDIINKNVPLESEIDNPHLIEAVEKAVEATINFGRGGRAIKVLNQYVPFLNVGFEGSKQAFRSLISAEKGKVKAALTLGALSVGNIMNNLYNQVTYPEFADIPKDVKNGGAFIIMQEPVEFYDDGRPKPNYRVLIPKTMEFALFLGVPSSAINRFQETFTDEALNAGIVGSAKEALAEYARGFGDIAHYVIPYDFFNKNPIHIADRVHEQIANKHFYFNAPIIDERVDQRPKPEQFDARTERLYRDVGKWTNSSPLRLKHLAESAPYGAKAVAGTYDFIADLFFEEEINPVTRANVEQYESYELDTDKRAFLNTLPYDQQTDLFAVLNRPDPSQIGQVFISKYNPRRGLGHKNEVRDSALRAVGADEKQTQNADESMRHYQRDYYKQMRKIGRQLEPHKFELQMTSGKTRTITPAEWVAKRATHKNNKANGEKVVAEQYPKSVIGLDAKDDYYDVMSNVDETTKLMNRYYSIKPETEDGRVLEELIGTERQTYTDREWNTFYNKRQAFIEALSKEDLTKLMAKIESSVEQHVELEYIKHVNNPLTRKYYEAFEIDNINKYLSEGKINLLEEMPYLSKLSKTQQRDVINKVFAIQEGTVKPKVSNNVIDLNQNPLLKERLQIAQIWKEMETYGLRMSNKRLTQIEQSESATKVKELQQQLAQLEPDNAKVIELVGDIEGISKNNQYLMRASDEKLANGLVKWKSNEVLTIGFILQATGISERTLQTLSGLTYNEISKGKVKKYYRDGRSVKGEIPYVPLHVSSDKIFKEYYLIK